MRIKYIALCLLLALVGCQRDEEMEITQLTISNEHIEPSCSSATISCDITSNVTIKQAKVYVSEGTDFSAAKTQVLSKKSGNTYSAEIDGLADGATYYVRYQISNRWVSLMAEEISEFQTIPATEPTVTTTQPKEITHNSAIMGGKIVDNGGLTITNCGVVYSKSPNPTIENGTKVESKEKTESFTCTINDLDFTTSYYARAYAINEKGIAYGEEISLTTLSTSATMGDISAIEIGGTTATIQAELLADGGANISQLGICYNLKGEPTTNDSVVLSSTNAVGVYQCTFNNLSKGTTYYVRAFATNANGIVYSEQISFKTEATIATVTTTQATIVSYTSATVGGNVTDDGGASVTERGVCYSTSANPTIANTKVASGSGTGAFSCNLTDLQDGMTYYARAYAINAKGTAYGEEVSFTTTAKTTATITTTQAKNISYNSAIVGGYVTSDGGASVTEHGVCYSTSANPTTANTKVTSGTGTGSFTCNLTDLQDGTTYYARAYAINAKGTAYGEEVSFTTIKIGDPLTFTVNGVSFTMIAVEGGTFTMGATAEQGSDIWDGEKPTHKVTLSDYMIGETEVTQELWKAVMGTNPSYFSGTQNPVEQVSWEDCQNFIAELNAMTGKKFRLPTEAEWEYAARGGNKSNGFKYAGSNTLGDVAWYTDNSGDNPHSVKQKQANELGIYDMSGNVWEWCQDWYGSYSSSAQTNPTGPSSGTYRTCRGGSWSVHAIHCRVSYRLNYTPTYTSFSLGLRLAL